MKLLLFAASTASEKPKIGAARISFACTESVYTKMYKVLRETNSWPMCPSKRPQNQKLSLAAYLLRALLLSPIAVSLPLAADDAPMDAPVAEQTSAVESDELERNP